MAQPNGTGIRQFHRIESTIANSFPPKMPLGEFLFEYLHRRGVRHSFGVPGDFALPTFAWLEKSKIRSITMTHEPSAGFAADAYSRVNGIGLVCVTYCVGGLNVLNAIAGAYAEKSPVVVVSGAPGRKDREKDPLLHHKVKTFETQRRVYEEVTVATTVLLDEQRAASEIVRYVEACLRHKRPVYIEVPHDMVDREIPTTVVSTGVPEEPDPHTFEAALDETLSLVRAAERPVILAGVELARYRTAGLVVRMAERMNIPIAADLLSKSAIPENHRLYIGVYGGAMSSDEHVRKYVESADLVLMLGTFITDMSMGFYTAKLDRRRTVLATTERVSVQYHRYESIPFRDFLEALASAKIPLKQFKHPNPHAVPIPLTKIERRDRLAMGGCVSHRFLASRRALLCRGRRWRRYLWRGRDSQREAGAIHRSRLLHVDGLCGACEHWRCHGREKAPPLRVGG
jgi:TPP-dependent 2-oxoacid decarboxylase